MDEWADDSDSAPRGVPAWIVTFGDLMSLLLCFFVLLWSFAEMDSQKFRAIASSLQASLGTAGGPATEEGGAPVSSGLIEEALPLEIIDPMQYEAQQESTPDDLTPTDLDTIDLDTAEQLLNEKIQQQSEIVAQQLVDALQHEIVQGKIELEVNGKRITLRIRESGSFASGQATIREDFLPVLASIADQLAKTEGQITVAGHTDDVIIETERFPSNWSLSAARAVSVADELLKSPGIPDQRMKISGHADTQPVVPNDGEENRARNRRVEIILERP